MCAPEWKIGFLGSSLFLGWCITLLWLPRLADVYGRKKLFLLGMTLDLALYTVLIFASNLDLMIAVIFCFGLCTSIRTNIGYIYMMELIPKRNQTVAGTSWGVLESSIMLGATCYFMLSSSKNWLYYCLIGYIMQVFAFFGSMILPESPKWLFE